AGTDLRPRLRELREERQPHRPDRPRPDALGSALRGATAPPGRDRRAVPGAPNTRRAEGDRHAPGRAVRRAGAAVLFLFAAAGLAGPPSSSDGAAKAAREFLAVLRPNLRSQCLLPFDGEERTVWSYLPGRRRGVSLKQMNEAERRAARAMLRE